MDPGDAKRSICGCEINSIRFRFFPDNIRVGMALESGETLDSLPVVDRDWHRFVALLNNQTTERLEAFFNSFVKKQVMSSHIRFVRIGITRPDGQGRCWLMLDSLFPLPINEWAKGFE